MKAQFLLLRLAKRKLSSSAQNGSSFNDSDGLEEVITGVLLGLSLARSTGDEEGSEDLIRLGSNDGISDGKVLGWLDGSNEGSNEGSDEGPDVILVGFSEAIGSALGASEANFVGELDNEG